MSTAEKGGGAYFPEDTVNATCITVVLAVGSWEVVLVNFSIVRAGGATQAAQAMAWATFGLQGDQHLDSKVINSTCLVGYRQITTKINYTVL